MQATALIAGFALGAAGSMHCVGMCGPLSLALPTQHLSTAGRFIALLLYQLGRMVTYSALGLLTGLVGRRIYIAGYQQWFSIAAGIIIAIAALLYFFRKRLHGFPVFYKLYAGVQQLVVKILRSSMSVFSFLLLGMANGLLPCGMVYIAMATTFSFATVGESVGFMVMFGAGTLPAMMAIAYAGQALRTDMRRKLGQVVPYFLLAMGVLLILRGMDLGVPFISPHLPAAPGQAVSCH